MTNYTAANLQAINNYAGLDNTVLELLVDAMVSHINAEAEATLPHFRDDGVNPAGSRIVAVTDAEEPAFLAGAALMLRAYKDKGPQIQAGPVGVAYVISDPHYTVWNRMLEQAIQRLCRTTGVPFFVAEDTSGIT